MTMVLAEKAVTALQRSTANTRWRDFSDIYQLTGQHSCSAEAARGSLAEVARFRDVSFPRSSGQLLLVADHAACAAS
jgi:hypothetical protein